MPETVFISHAVSDKALATLLKEVLEEALLGGVSCFVSSDRESIPTGSQWFDEIRAAIKRSKLALVLCSPNSIERPWINFEAGAAYFHGLLVTPVCVLGLKPHDLRPPLSTFQSVDSTSKDDLMRLIESVAKAAELRAPRGPEVINKLMSVFQSAPSPAQDAPHPDPRKSKAKRIPGTGIADVSPPQEPAVRRFDRIAKLSRWTSPGAVSWPVGEQAHWIPGRRGHYELYVTENLNTGLFGHLLCPPSEVIYAAIQRPGSMVNWDAILADTRLILADLQGTGVQTRFIVASSSDWKSQRTEILNRFDRVLSFVPEHERSLFTLELWDDEGLVVQEKVLGLRV